MKALLIQLILLRAMKGSLPSLDARCGPPQSTTSYFCYRNRRPSDLEQGDIIAKAPPVQEAISSVYPNYLRSDYTHLIVLTQSCDLVRRKGKPCETRYINVAAVRPVELVIEREIEKYQDDFDKEGMVCSAKHQFILKQFLHRLLNNNVSDYFYLPAEPTLDFPHARCAFLRLSIALKSDRHYETCLQARKMSLKENFQAKLGWLIGNMYARVGTEEWIPSMDKDQRAFDDRISDMLKRTCKWIEEKTLVKAKVEAPPGLAGTGQEAIRAYIETIKVDDPKELVVEAVIAELKKFHLVTSSEQADKIANRLRNNPIISKHTKPQV